MRLGEVLKLAARRAHVLGLLVASACVGGSDLGLGEEAARPPSEGALRISMDRERGELVLEMQPVNIPPGDGHGLHDEHRGGQQPPTQYGTLPVSGWLHGYYVELVDARGNPVPRELLHHVNIIAPDRRELFSPIMQRMGAAGNETSPVSLPWFLGYPVERGDRILLGGMLHNPTKLSYDDVRIRVRMPITGGQRWVRPARVYPFYLDVMPPASVHRFDLPPGRSERSWEGRPALSGRILGMGGHLHKYAVELRLEDRTTGELLWQTSPIVDDQGEVVGMPQHRLWWRLGLRMRDDHVYRLTAVYHNPTGETIPEGGMGALGGVFMPTPGLPWPAADPSHGDYRLDVRLTEAGSRAPELMTEAAAPSGPGAASVGASHVHPGSPSPAHVH